ncbi:hypothetical protein [Hyphococcus sp.]|jgi:flagellar biosynthesis/type III secretory pathway protein FliH|uniref:hypothetical protein n=1 Tax=Hyphococcus sp. TaxID=2038636 RepID=UPI003D135031
MNALRAYTPSRDFSPLKSAVEEVEAAPEAPGLSAEEVEHLIAQAVADARTAAFAEGEMAGRNAAEASHQAAAAEAVAALHRRLDEILDKEDAILKEVETRAVRLILSVAQKVAVSISETEAENIAVDVARRALEAARGSSKIIFRVSQEMGDVVIHTLSSSLSKEMKDGRIVIERDASLRATSVQVKWDTGAVVFDPDALKKSVSDILSNTLANLSDAHEAQHTLKEAGDEQSDERS